jgi:methionine-gamma-lyase
MPPTHRPATALVARAAAPRARQEPVSLPIHQTTTFVIDEALDAAMARGDYRSEFLYTRMGNPTVRALEERLALLHGADDGVATASGMGALSAALIGLTAAGDGIVAARQLYGVSAALLTRYLADMGREVAFADATDTGAVQAALAGLSRPRWLLVETLSNPLVEVAPLAELADAAHRAGARLMVDNTFANPLGCRPLSRGADLVIESLSKSISGHSDVHGGLVAGSRTDVERAWDAMVHLGPCLDPHAAALIWRGLKTLDVRTRAATETASRLAGALSGHPAVEAVHHPTLASGRARSVADATLDLAGSMLSIVVKGGDTRALALLQALEVAVPATSLGGVETLVSCPFNTSHRSAEARQRVGLRPGTVRISVGLEAYDDLWADWQRALDATAPR